MSEGPESDESKAVDRNAEALADRSWYTVAEDDHTALGITFGVPTVRPAEDEDEPDDEDGSTS